MASFWYQHALAEMAKGNIDWDGSDIRIALLSTNTTADTEKDKTTVSGFTTLDEYDGAAYARKAIGSEAVVRDDANFRAELGGTSPITWSALGAGTRQAQGMLVYKHVTNDADSIPIAWIDTGGFPFAGNGGDVTLTFNAEGLLQLQA